MRLEITTCDVCNPHQALSGRGYIVWRPSVAVKEFGWKRLPEGKHICQECQDERKTKI